VGSTDGVSRVIAEAATGRLPAWAEVSGAREAHLTRVAALIGEWAERLPLSAADRVRWRAAAYLHDALRDADPERLRPLVPAELRDLPRPILHGPAAAERLAGEADDELRDSIRYHTIGHPGLGLLGRALYLADFLEPGRNFCNDQRAEMRSRMPFEIRDVLVEVIGMRIRHLLEVRKPIRSETAAFWSRVVAEGSR
jgi:HD superfamily phosphohydrolase YqeK